jgi:hypothetical protein
MTKKISYRDWYIPLAEDDITLAEALDFLRVVGAPPQKIPLIIQVMENPKFNIGGKTLFHGAVTLHQHDCIHIVLGRGLLPKDEAFTIGFTMGSTHQVSTTEENLFALIAQNFYPDVYKFSEEDSEVFHDAIKLGTISHCMPLTEFDFDAVQHQSLKSIRALLGLETDLLAAYFAIEGRRYGHCQESRRLCEARGPRQGYLALRDQLEQPELRKSP